MPTRNPTTREIAAACGCNQSTVSHALRGHAKIPLATRKRVRAVAEKLGWRPNPLAAAYMAHLRTTRTPAFQASLGFLNTHPESGHINSLPLYMGRHFRGAQDRARELGYALEPIWLHEPHLTARRLASILRNRNITGLIVGGILKPSEILEKLDWKHYAAVALGFSLTKPQLHRVAVHTSHGFHLMLTKAVELGYRRIAVIVSEAYDERVDHGVLYPAYFLQKHLPKTHRILTHIFPAPNEEAVPGIQEWIIKNRPEIILGEEIVWQSLRRMKWRVPQDVAFINNDWSPEYPKNAGFNQHHELHGSVAVDMVVSALMQNERGLPSVPRLTLIEGEFAEGLAAPAKEVISTISQPVNIL